MALRPHLVVLESSQDKSGNHCMLGIDPCYTSGGDGQQGHYVPGQQPIIPGGITKPDFQNQTHPPPPPPF